MVASSHVQPPVFADQPEPVTMHKVQSKAMRYVPTPLTNTDTSIKDQIVAKLVQSAPKDTAVAFLLPLEPQGLADASFTQRYAVFNDQHEQLGEVLMKGRFMLDKEPDSDKSGKMVDRAWDALFSSHATRSHQESENMAFDDLLNGPAGKHNPSDMALDLFDELVIVRQVAPARAAEVKLSWSSSNAGGDGLFAQWSLAFEKALNAK
jgi:hypothetical protein